MLIKSDSSDSIDIATKGSRVRVVLRNRNGVAILTERRSSYAAREAHAPHRTWLSNYSMQPSAEPSRPLSTFLTIHRMVKIVKRPVDNLLREISLHFLKNGRVERQKLIESYMLQSALYQGVN